MSKQDAMKAKWFRMPFEPILEALAKRTAGRIIRADDDWIGRTNAPESLRTGSIGAVRSGKHWVEVDIR